MICRHKLYHFTVANTQFIALLTRRSKTKFATIKWYNLCLQIIQSQTCYPLIATTEQKGYLLWAICVKEREATVKLLSMEDEPSLDFRLHNVGESQVHEFQVAGQWLQEELCLWNYCCIMSFVMDGVDDWHNGWIFYLVWQDAGKSWRIAHRGIAL